jgi:hypothetical protein
MGSKLTMTLVSESQEGKIGDDWKYTLHTKVYNEGLKGEGSINIKKHTLGSGQTQEPPGPPDPLVMEAGIAGSTLNIEINLKATEVDFFKSDSGEHSIKVAMNTPESGAEPVRVDTDISVGVQESPGFVDQTAVLTLKLKLVATSD